MPPETFSQNRCWLMLAATMELVWLGGLAWLAWWS